MAIRLMQYCRGELRADFPGAKFRLPIILDLKAEFYRDRDSLKKTIRLPIILNFHTN